MPAEARHTHHRVLLCYSLIIVHRLWRIPCWGHHWHRWRSHHCRWRRNRLHETRRHLSDLSLLLLLAILLLYCHIFTVVEEDISPDAWIYSSLLILKCVPCLILKCIPGLILKCAPGLLLVISFKRWRKRTRRHGRVMCRQEWIR